MQTTRRSFLGGLAAATLPAGAIAASAAVPTKQTAKERFEYHLEEMKRAAEELDPLIGSWHISPIEDDGARCALLVSAFRVTGRYEGDGIYEAGEEHWNGNRIKYRVTLLPDRIDDERLFKVTTTDGSERLQLLESRLETVIGRRLA